MSRSKKGPSAPRVLVRRPVTRNSGMQDFSGQDSGKPSASPAAEARGNLDARPKLTFAPTIDDPSRRKAISTIISSDAIERRLGK
jgi:hypothetical protein